MPATSQKPDSAVSKKSTTNTQGQQNRSIDTPAQPQQSTSGAATTPNNGTAASTTTPATGAKVNRPSDSRFKQQKLKAWQPILTAGTVLPTFFVIGLIFIPIGVVLFVTSNNVSEYVYDYTDHQCNVSNVQETLSEDIKIAVRAMPCKDVMKNQSLMDYLTGETCKCQIGIFIPDEIKGPVYIYYGLTNFYQNHRRYVKSRDDVQLMGDYLHTVDDCEPFQRDNGLKIVPCGAVANSLFNDTFEIYKFTNGVNNNALMPVGLLYTDIAWPSDRTRKFFNPPGGWDHTNKTSFTRPRYWKKNIYDLSNVSDENGFTNESFIVWMRTAALPTFRKLHSRIDHSSEPEFKNGLPAGNYSISIGYNYPVDSFDGRKRFIISNTSWAGGKNPFLGVAYIVVGSLCILTGFIFLLIHMKFGKSLTELASVS